MQYSYIRTGIKKTDNAQCIDCNMHKMSITHGLSLYISNKILASAIHGIDKPM
jgi:hypothetical protein